MEARENILAEIEQTIAQLVENAAILKRISGDPLYLVEAQALDKTQESLLAHLLHLEHYQRKKQTPPIQLDKRVKRVKSQSRPRVKRSKKVPLV